MVFKYKEYKLYTRTVNLVGGKKQTIYFFSKKKPNSGTECDMPNYYSMEVSKKTGMPYLKYSEGRKSTWKIGRQ
ncbi:MAG: hypothetical protein NT038_10600 [Euryarchaeota archaeon]|nr:hypothetical protein [Euryarchaeota archaeon]